MGIEQWKQFEETDTKTYLVSTEGRVKNVNKETGKETLMSAVKNRDGRKLIFLPSKKGYYIYRLVAEAFIPNPENKPTVNHINGLDAGDHVENLEWATMKEQCEHSYETGLATPGNTPAIVLDSNGIEIARYENIGKALKSYSGRQIYYNKDVQIIGNVIVMKQAYFDGLSESEILNICFECFERMVEFAYVVDNQLIENNVQTITIVGTSQPNLIMRSKNKKSIIVNGYEVSRLANRIGVFNDNNPKEKPIYEQVTIK